MTVTTSYSVTADAAPFTLPSADANYSYLSSVTALSNGGYAVLTQDTESFSDLYIYNAAGTLVGSNTGFDATDAKLVQLANGNILVAGTTNNRVDYRIFTQTGQVVEADAVMRSANHSNISVAAMANGGFATAGQLAFAGTDHDIYITIHAPGSTSPQIIVADTSADDDENPAITQIADGGLVIAWERIDSSGHSTLWDEILNANGSVRQAATELDGAGTVNHQPSVTALQNGGFTITYEDNGWDGAQSDITEANYSAAGIFQGYVRLSSLSTADSQAATAVLTGGVVVTAFTHLFVGNDTDIYLSAYNPVTGDPLITAQSLYGANSTDIESLASVAALGNNRFAVSFTDTTTATTQLGIYELVRHTTGDAADNALAGDTLQDYMDGGAGNDLLIPGDGANNTAMGGLGYDTVQFSGARAGYSITRSGLNTIVTRPDGGTDTLTTVEKLHFADQDVFTPQQVRDLDGDGMSDILLQNNDGSVAVWQMNGSTITAKTVESRNPGTGWHIKGSGNFSFAADNNADILFQNNDGSIAIWQMTGGVYNSTTVLTTNPGSAWHVINSGDFNGDGQADILLQNTDSHIAIWLMNGTTIASKTVESDNPGTAWHAIGTGDFDGDGKSDIIWQNTDGEIAIWKMNGATVVSKNILASNNPGSAWHVRGAGDFDGDGKAELLLQNTSGAVAIWKVNGTDNVTKTVLATNPGSSWVATGAADYNGDGKSDITFQNSDGSIGVWTMNGTTIASHTSLSTYPGAAWHVIAGAGG